MAGTRKKNPTNAEIMTELVSLRQIVKPLVPQVKELMDEKHDRELIAKYLAANPPVLPLPPSRQGPQLNQDLIKALGMALAVILALVTLVASYHGVVGK